MTRYTVIWDDDVESPFIEAWVEGGSEKRAMLTEIANWVDANLAQDPDSKGQFRPDLAAHIVAVPLSSSPARVSVSYEVWPEGRQVRIIRLTICSG